MRFSRVTPPVALVGILAAGLLGVSSSANAAGLLCGSTVTADTTLDRDLRGCPGAGLVVSGSDITIDLAGHTIGGVGNGVGVQIEGDNVVVKDGSIVRFATGIQSDERLSGTRLVRLRVSRNVGNGVVFFSVGETLQDSKVSSNGSDGVLLAGSDASTIIGNRVVRNGGTGIIARPHADGARYVDNVVSENGGDGIGMNNSLALEITGNTARRNAGDGIFILEGSPGFPQMYVITGNDAERNGKHGIEACFDDTLAGNPCAGGFTDGGGNVAKHNATEPQCINVTCARRPGQA